MAKEKKDKNFIKKPVYEGGPKAMKEFVRKNLTYPAEALEKKIEGTVYIKYTIDYRGNVIETKVISSLGHGCDEEAERLVKMLTFKVPKNRGIKVLFHKNIQIHFRLPKTPKKANKNMQVTYTYSSQKSKKTSNEEKKDKSSGYSYTIDI